MVPGNIYAQLYEQCSAQIPAPTAKVLACPRSYRACHKTEYLHVLDAKTKPTVVLSISNQYFIEGEACFFEVEVSTDSKAKLEYQVQIDF